jgi:hypothetical protein
VPKTALEIEKRSIGRKNAGPAGDTPTT